MKEEGGGKEVQREGVGKVCLTWRCHCCWHRPPSGGPGGLQWSTLIYRDGWNQTVVEG